MDIGKIPEQGAPRPEDSKQLEAGTVDNLPERLGFLETDELRLLKHAALVAHLEGKPGESRELRNHYQLVGERAVDELQGEDYTKAQIGLIVAVGNLRRDTGRVAAYINDLDDALMYASGAGYVDVATTLEGALSKAIAQNG